MQHTRESIFLLSSAFGTLHTECGLHDQNINSGSRRDFCSHKMTRFLARVVSRVQYALLAYLNEEPARNEISYMGRSTKKPAVIHAGTEDVPCRVRSKAESWHNIGCCGEGNGKDIG